MVVRGSVAKSSRHPRRKRIEPETPAYTRYGVAHAWLVDPLARTLEAFELRDGQWVLLGAIGEDAPVCFPPFAAITFSLADLWV
ncbi:MAG: Uma2 family endonuclease [Candidatus Competibacteraceae bacterium]